MLYTTRCCNDSSTAEKPLIRERQVVADLKGLFTFWENIPLPGEPAGQQSPRPPDQRRLKKVA